MHSLADVDLSQPIDWTRPLNQGRLSWWTALPLRTGSPNLYDLVGRMPGTFKSFGSTTGWRGPIRKGECASILGTSASGCYIDIPTVADLLPSLPFTVALTLQTTTTANQVVFECNGNSGFSVQMGAVSSGQISCWCGTGGDGPVSVSGMNIGDAAPHRILFGVSAVAGASVCYVDGKNQTDPSHTAGGTTPSYAGAPYYLFSRAGSFGFDGSLNDVSVWQTFPTAEFAALDARVSQQAYPRELRRRKRDIFLLEGSGGSSATVALTPAALAFVAPPVSVSASASTAQLVGTFALASPPATAAASAVTAQLPGGFTLAAPPAAATAGTGALVNAAALQLSAAPIVAASSALSSPLPAPVAWSASPVSVSTGTPADALPYPGGIVWTAAPATVSSSANAVPFPAGTGFPAAPAKPAASSAASLTPGGWSCAASPAQPIGSSTTAAEPAALAFASPPVAVSTQSGTTNPPTWPGALAFIAPPVAIAIGVLDPDILFVEPSRPLAFVEPSRPLLFD